MSRMSFGDHLEELRRRLILSLAGIAVGAGVALAFSKHIQAILLRPLDVVLQRHGDELKMIALAPPDLFLNWLKIGLISGAILVMPWVLYQMWSFVGAGLYGHERRWVKRFAPMSVGLFATGVLFMYFIVLPIVLNFFVGFNRGFTVSNEPPSGLQRMLLGIDPPAEIDDDAPTPDLPPIPILQADPANPPPNSMWVNRRTHQFIIQGDKQRWAVPLEDADDRSVVSSNFAIKDYMSFVLSLMLAFGIAFEVPIVVVFLAITGMVPAETMAGARRYVIFAIVVAAMFLTPPDVISQILLAVPMMALFEGGLMMARILERKREATD